MLPVQEALVQWKIPLSPKKFAGTQKNLENTQKQRALYAKHNGEVGSSEHGLDNGN